MIGLLYLPRLFVYHNNTKYISEMDTTFLLMLLVLIELYNDPCTYCDLFTWFSFII